MISRSAMRAAVSARPCVSTKPTTASIPRSRIACASSSIRYVLPTPAACPRYTFRFPRFGSREASLRNASGSGRSRGVLDGTSRLWPGSLHDDDVDVRRAAQHLDVDARPMAHDGEIDCCSGHLQVVDADLVQGRREPRPREEDAPRGRVDLDPDADLEEKQYRGRRPGLGRARDRIEDGTFPRLPWEAAEKLGHALQREVDARVEERFPQRARLVHEAVPREPPRDERVVVRPDGPVVIGQRAVATLRSRDRPEAPAGERLGRKEGPGEAAGVLRACDAREEALAGAGSAHATEVLAAVERHAVRGELLAPEGSLEALLERFGLHALARRLALVAEEACERGARAMGRVRVPLDLAERDRAFGVRAVLVKDGVVGIPPALVAQPVWRAPFVLQETVAITVAAAIHPCERGPHVRPELLCKRTISGALVIGAGEDDEERRRIDAPVIAAEGNLAERGNLSLPRFVQDPARLRLLSRDDFHRLRGGEVGEDAFRQCRAHPEAFERRQDPVPAERRVEPRHARVGVRAGGQVRREHVEVRDGSVDPGVDQAVRRRDVARPRSVALEIRLRLRAGLLVGEKAGSERASLAADGQEERRLLLRREGEVEARARARQNRWPRREGEHRTAHLAVEPAVGEDDTVRTDLRREVLAPLAAFHAAYLEDVGVVGCEAQRERALDGFEAEVADFHLLVQHAAPEELADPDVQRAERHADSAAAHEIGVRERDGELVVLVADGGVQEERPPAFEVEQERG